jgi:hypothetical protein
MWLCVAVPLAAGVVKGVALEWATGRPLSRTIVNLVPVPGSGGVQAQTLQTRTGRSGQFQFSAVPDGLYLLETQREGFLPAGHGQRRPTGYGTPIVVSSDSSLFSELRLHRMGAISGTVMDENGVGIPRVNVIAYLAQLPLRVAGRAVADDRGVYRIGGLGLGKYWVRTGSHVLDDGAGLLPYFGPESDEPRDAQIHEVRLDNESIEANIRPRPGSLSALSGRIVCDHAAGSPVTVTLSSEFSRQTFAGNCGGGYSFLNLAPAHYEISATYADGSGSSFMERQISGNAVMPLQVVSTNPVLIETRNAASRVPQRIPIQLWGRRDDLSGPDNAREVPLPSAMLAGGYWQFTAAVAPSQYVVSLTSESGDIRRTRRGGRGAEWFPVYLVPFRGGERIRIVISDRAGQIGGTVRHEGKAAPGVPVFLWPVKEETRRMLGGARQLLSDVDGRYRFPGLPPGEYRVVATMDAREASEELAGESKAAAVILSEGQAAGLDLTVWVAP